MTDAEAKGEGNLQARSIRRSSMLLAYPFPGRTVTVLCAARSSVYRAIPGVDTITRTRNAWHVNPQGPIVAHPPCRCWSRAKMLSSMTTLKRIEEMLLGMECVRLVIKNGGVLEHPAHSRLWACAHLPRPESSDHSSNVWSICIDQANYGYPCCKPTWLLFSRISAKDVLFCNWNLAPGTLKRQMDVTPGLRSRTPADFAAFLIRCANHSRPTGEV